MANSCWTQFYKVALGCFPVLQFTTFSVKCLLHVFEYPEKKFTLKEGS